MSISWLLLLFAPLPLVVLAAAQPTVCKELLRDIRPGRIVHYYLLFIFGFVCFRSTPEKLLHTDVQTALTAIVYFFCLAYAAVFAIATNNKADLEIDKITNTERPLVRGTIETRPYLRIAVISLLFSLVLSALAHPVFLMSIVGISLIYFVYSCKPFRLKRFVFLAKMLIGINSLLAAEAGFVLAGGKWSEFPVFWLVFILVPVSLMANFIDLKDTAGDRAAGIKTLPVLFGDRRARYLIGLFTLIAYGFVLYYFQSIWITILLIFTCFIHVFLLFRQPYHEKPLFLLHNTLFLGLTSLLILESVLKNR